MPPPTVSGPDLLTVRTDDFAARELARRLTGTLPHFRDEAFGLVASRRGKYVASAVAIRRPGAVPHSKIDLHYLFDGPETGLRTFRQQVIRWLRISNWKGPIEWHRA